MTMLQRRAGSSRHLWRMGLRRHRKPIPRRPTISSHLSSRDRRMATTGFRVMLPRPTSDGGMGNDGQCKLWADLLAWPVFSVRDGVSLEDCPALLEVDILLSRLHTSDILGTTRVFMDNREAGAVVKEHLRLIALYQYGPNGCIFMILPKGVE